MEAQCRKYRSIYAVMAEAPAAKELASRLSDVPTTVLCGEEGLIRVAEMDEADTVVTAVVGMLGLKPTLAAIRKKKRIALANKETLVCAGELVMAEAKKYGSEIIPVDSEHSAIFQCLMGGNRSEISKLILTCSGGPFFGYTTEQLQKVTKEDALKHPNWKMGPKITVDCATLMNKGLEVIEAMRLYSVPADQVQVVIHRQSIIHSMVEFCDGAVMAQMGTPDMRLPIQLALTYPNRMPSPAGQLDLYSMADMTFHRPDLEAFPALALALQAAKTGGTACPVLNGANEVAVGLFLQNKIGFYDICDGVKAALDAIAVEQASDLETVLLADAKARKVVLERYSS
jgi:1-deoxy-D-xylulose-5-phosphate reductoisomerase